MWMEPLPLAHAQDSHSAIHAAIRVKMEAVCSPLILVCGCVALFFFFVFVLCFFCFFMPFVSFFLFFCLSAL